MSDIGKDIFYNSFFDDFVEYKKYQIIEDHKSY